jgi:uncharacterized protein (TIGR02231 family)
MSRNTIALGILVLAVTAWAAVAASAAALAAELTGQVTGVTLYRGQALVTRTIPLEGPKGPAEVVVANLPEQVVSGSLFAEGSEGVEVRAVRYRTRAVGEEPREVVRELEEQIDAVKEKIELNKRALELLGKRTAYLDQLEGFVAPTAKTDLAKGVLNAETLQKVTLFSFEQRKTIATEAAALDKDNKEQTKALVLLDRKRAELTKGASHTVREALLFVEKKADAKETLRLSYLVSGCGWSPAYTFRAGKDRKEVAVECNALIQQMTGEDWSGVSLTLSTASPALAAAGPGLAPFPVALGPAGGSIKSNEKDLGAQLQSIRGRQSAAITLNNSTVTLSDNISSGWTINAAANDFQNLELSNPKEVWSLLKSEDVGAGEGPSMSYQLAGSVSLASRADQQMVRILHASFKSVFYQVATPVLTSYVYREAELTNNSPEDLLGGPITVYLDGRFVGRGEIPTVARGQTFIVGFGVDPQVRARRELASRRESVQGGNRELSFQYRLVIENYKDEVVPLRVFDRLPYSDRGADVRIKLGDLKDPLSEDKVYLRTERPKNILRWDITVPAAATGEKARFIDYGFTVDFDRNLALNPVGESPAQLQREFERMQRARMAK